MPNKSIDELKEETDALLRRCNRLRDDDERRDHISLCEKQLISAGWAPRDVERVTNGVQWILDIDRD